MSDPRTEAALDDLELATSQIAAVQTTRVWAQRRAHLVEAALAEFPGIVLSADIRHIVERSYAAGFEAAVRALDVELLEKAAASYRILDADVPGARYTVANRHYVEAIAAEYLAQCLARNAQTPLGLESA